MLTILDEATPPLPLAEDVERDDQGWAILRLRFERTLGGTARQLLRLGAQVEALDPPELRTWLADETVRLAERYGKAGPPG
jgi:hypothetical protein